MPSFEVTTSQLEEDTWQVDCRFVPHTFGNTQVVLKLAAIVDGGERVLQNETFHFYVSKSNKE